jgi:F-type H+-transporting ATPase subunit a
MQRRSAVFAISFESIGSSGGQPGAPAKPEIIESSPLPQKNACEKFHYRAISLALQAACPDFQARDEAKLVVFTSGSMRLFTLLFIVAVLTGQAALWAADPAGTLEAGTTNQHGATAETAHHGLPPGAVDLWKGVPITNSMVVTWVVALALIVFARYATRKIEAVPSGVQNFWEWMVESLRNFLEGIIGRELVQKTFWFFASIFIFILFANWFGLIPGVGTIGWGTSTSHGFHVTQPLLRGANADLNMTLAMAVVFFVCWTVWALQANGPGGFLLHLFGPKGETTGLLKVLMVLVFIAVGLLEVVSILFRPVSLSFRLYGNIFAGENMLESMARLVPGWLGSIIIPIPFYFLEVLVGLVQALVFMLLTAVFTLLICTHEEGHETAHH